MRFFLKLSHWIDVLNVHLGRVANIAILLSCIVSASNALVRYGFDRSSNWALELQWHLFAAAVMFGAAYTFQRNEHVRVDLIYGYVSDRGKLWIDVFGILIFLFPSCILFTWLAWKSLFLPSWETFERSSNMGGLPVYHIKALVPLGFALLTLQGISELIKRIVALLGMGHLEARYERPVQ